MIGLVDITFQQAEGITLPPPNLEVMKLAAYYRLEESKFCRLIPLDEYNFEPEAYEKIYCFSEHPNKCEIPPHFYRANNLIFGGTAFTNGTYIPFENSIIDFTLPRVSIYKEFLKKKYQDGVKMEEISHILDDTYYRMYAGEQRLPIPPIKSKKRVWLYDKDFFYPDWELIIKEIVKRKPSSIFRIHPIVCNNLKQFFDVRKTKKLSLTNEIIFDLKIPIDEIPYLFKEYKNKLLAEITPSSNIYLTLGGTMKTHENYYRDFIYKINLLYSFWSNSIPIKIKYIPPNLGTIYPLESLASLIVTWSKSGKKTLNERCGKKPSAASQDRDLLLKFHPYAKDLFNQTYSDLSARRLWKI